MSMIKKLSNVLKEVFWIKTTEKKAPRTRKTVRKSSTKSAKKLPSRSNTAKSKKPIIKEKVSKISPKTKESNPIKLKVSKKPKVQPIDENLVPIGEITHYFERIKVCVVKISQGTVLIGDKLTIIGAKTKFVQKVWSMQIESLDVKVAKKGQSIGLKVDKPVVVGDVVYK